jgi:antitoxin FitA
MATLTIRKLDDTVKTKLRVRAAENGRSMEEEARAILEGAVQAPRAAQEKPRSFYQSIRRCLADAGLDGIDLEIPPRGPMRAPPDFSGPEFPASDDE